MPKRAGEPEGGEGGLRCPSCGCPELPVLYTRKSLKGIIQRVRRCRHCNRRIITREQALGVKSA